MLGVGKDIVFFENRVGASDVIIATAGDNCPPTAAGNIGETNVIAKTVAATKKRDSKRPLQWQILNTILVKILQISGIDAKSQRMFFPNEEISLQSVADKSKTAAKNRPAEIIEESAS